MSYGEQFASGPIQSLTPMRSLGRLSVGNLFGWAHAVLGERWGTLAACAALMVIYGFISSIITGVLDALIVGSGAWFSPFSFLNNLLIAAPLSVGPVYIAACTFRGQDASFSDITIGFRRWGPILLIALIIQLSLWAAMLPMGIAMSMLQRMTGNSAVMIVAMIALGLTLLIGTIYIGIRIYFANLLCADPLGPRLGAVQSIKESWRITRTHALPLFAAAVLIGIIAGICFMLLLVPGVLYGLPLSYAATGAAYVYLTHRSGIIPVEGYDVCPFCEYNLSDLDVTRCPECGAHVPRPEPRRPDPFAPKPRPDELPPQDDLPDIPLSE